MAENEKMKPEAKSNETPQQVEASTLIYPKKVVKKEKITDELDEGLYQIDQEDEGKTEQDVTILVDPTPEKFEQLVHQLKAKLTEGQGEALYDIGVEDNGFLRGVSDEVLQKSIETLKRMAQELKSEASLVCERKGKEGKVAVMLVREQSDERYIDIRMAVCGNVDSGKSTMCGVLTRGKLDNGRGLVRVNLFNHKHEMESGRTSSISHQIMGFNVKGECVNYSWTSAHPPTWGDIIEHSYKIISFLDLAGHEKYLKTTVSGMTGHMPDYALLLIGSNMGVTRMTKEHLGLALALKIPVVVVITKVDLCPENILKQTLADINKILKMRGVRKISMMINNDDDVITAIKNIGNDRTVPIFLVSNVTGQNLDLLRKFLNLLPQRIQWNLLRDKRAEVLIDQTYFVTGVGTVVSGTVMSGQVESNSTMLLGPDSNGHFIPVQVKSIHSKRVPVRTAVAGQNAGFALKKIKRSTIRKGMVLVASDLKPKATWAFTAEVIILYHSTTIHANYQPVVQCLTMRQSAKIIKIFDKDVLRTGDRATVKFRFLYFPEFVKTGMRIIFREGRCKGIGIITAVNFTDDEDETNVKKEGEKRSKEGKGGMLGKEKKAENASEKAKSSNVTGKK
eukprot:TRINITY_DN294_c0_g1_i1.p1 TRINITY_DN294_c0_g1~~TRINITY_DN294_c0_g1_i1.p1  ORF type:complete len:644 (-),score=144.22 TRINITY_DN294_c0_g1_i1:45-1907(-)